MSIDGSSFRLQAARIRIDVVLKDLTKSDWLRILNIPESRIPEVLILRGTRNFQSQYATMLPFFEDVQHIGTPNGILEDVLIGNLRGRSAAFACVYGPSMASEVVHVFGTLGTRAVIQTGCCGALANNLSAGDLVIAAEAFCGEGVARYYLPEVERVSGSAELLNSKAFTRLKSTKRHVGPIYTTSALFAEGADDVERWAGADFCAVDMETATTFAVAEYFAMRRASILYVFDNPRRQEHLLLNDAEKDRRRALANNRMREIAFDLAEEAAEN